MKRIGMFLGQINLDTQRKVILGIYNQCQKHNIDLDVFSFYSSNQRKYNLGEFEYINRIDMDLYDGFILYVETIYSEELREKLIEKIHSLHKEVVSIDYDINNGANITTDNYYAMQDVVEHLITEHGVKTVNFIGGPINSSDTEKRMQACKDVLEKHGLSLPPHRIYFGDFFADSGTFAIEYFKNYDLLDADAYVCANDQMALGVYNELTNLGINVPDDAIITGFDDIYQAKHNIPSITSVRRREDYVGVSAFYKLMLLVNDNELNDEYVKASPIFRGSCCKTHAELNTVEILTAYKKYLLQSVDSTKYSKILNDSSAEFVAAKSIEELAGVLPKYLKKYNVTEFCMCLDDGKSNMLNVPVHYLLKDESSISETIDKKDVIPKLKDKEEGNLSIIIPLHYLDNYYGYVVVNNYQELLYNELFRTFINSISNALESIHNAAIQEKMYKELAEASNHDYLTKLLNRNGFFPKANEMYKVSKENNEPMFIIFSDLDGLKTVNDSKGHECGDAFIRDYANALVHINEKYNYLIMRFGGDEFVVFGANATKEDANKFVSELNDYIEELNDSQSLKYAPCRLGASIGIHELDNSSNLSLYRQIDAADKDMYQDKLLRKTR